MTKNSRFERVYGDIEVVCIDHNIIGEDRFFDDGDYDKFVKSLNELHEENEQLKKELKFIKSELSDCMFDTRQRTLNEVKEEIEKLERYE